MANRIILRRDTAANWANVDPVLANGEIGLETDTERFKIGNGIAPWSERDYYANAQYIATQYMQIVNQALADITNTVGSVELARDQALLTVQDFIDTANEQIDGVAGEALVYVDQAAGHATTALGHANTANTHRIAAASSANVAQVQAQIATNAVNDIADTTDAAINTTVINVNSDTRDTLDRYYNGRHFSQVGASITRTLTQPITSTGTALQQSTQLVPTVGELYPDATYLFEGAWQYSMLNWNAVNGAVLKHGISVQGLDSNWVQEIRDEEGVLITTRPYTWQWHGVVDYNGTDVRGDWSVPIVASAATYTQNAAVSTNAISEFSQVTYSGVVRLTGAFYPRITPQFGGTNIIIYPGGTWFRVTRVA
jgi:hypothetical protein